MYLQHGISLGISSFLLTSAVKLGKVMSPSERNNRKRQRNLLEGQPNGRQRKATKIGKDAWYGSEPVGISSEMKVA